MDKVILKSFWESLYTSNVYNNFKSYFADIFQDLFHKYREIHIYSVFGPTVNLHQKEKDILYVQFSGERDYRCTDLYDINLIPSLETANIISHTLGGQHLYVHNMDIKLFYNRREFIKTKFCSFIVSNSGPKERINFFNLLNEYKQVDSCGKWNNTIGYSIPDIDTPEYYSFMSNYKFTICFENSQVDYYFTEKLLNAYVAGTVPIYWGCKQIPEFINTRAIILVDDYQDAVNKIRLLDNDHELYKKVYNQPLFKNCTLPRLFDKDVIREKILQKLKLL
jgi:hypothetical protein